MLKDKGFPEYAAVKSKSPAVDQLKPSQLNSMMVASISCGIGRAECSFWDSLSRQLLARIPYG